MGPTFFSSKTNRLLGSLVLAMIVVALASYAVLTARSAKLTKDAPTTISVNGDGEVKVAPNLGQFSFSVMAKGKTAQEAQSTSTTRMNDILAFLKSQGIEDKDIKTSDYSLSPKFTYESAMMPCDGWNCPPPKEIPDGFEVSQMVTVKVHDASKAGALLAGVGEKGATGISSLSFTLEDDKPAKAEARDKAAADAKEKAQKIAQQFGMKLGRMTGYYENQTYADPVAYGGYAMDMAKSETAPVPTPTGEQKVTASVSVTYELDK
jgi:uncharacterized protein YggE